MIRNMRGSQIPSENQWVWRYMNLAKFQSILQGSKLFFPTLALLRNIDPSEGSWENFTFAQAVGSSTESLQHMLNYLRPIYAETASHQVAVSCWHINDEESKTMWEGYLPDGEGVAIQTSFSSLKDSFIYDHPEWPTCGGNLQESKAELMIAQVEYLAWSNPPLNTNTVKQAMFKDRSFLHENELCVIILLFPIPGAMHSITEDSKPLNDESLGLSQAVRDQIKAHDGVFIPVNIKKLVNSVYIAPNASPAIEAEVRKLVQMYDLNVDIYKSTS
jgi:hypothetical protein